MFGYEVIHHAQEACGQEEANGIVAIPPLHHRIHSASVHRVRFEQANRDFNAVYHVQQGHCQDKRAIKPVGHVNVFHLARGDGAEEHNGVRHPNQGNQDVDGPFQLGIFFTCGQTQRQGNGGQHNDGLPTPECESGQFATKQAGITRALNAVIRGGKQATAAKGKNHGIGVQRT